MKVSILNSRFSSVQSSIEKLNKRAAKLGLEPIKMEIVRSFTKNYSRGDNGLIYWNKTGPFSVQLLELEINGEIPIIDGWNFVGKIEYLDKENQLFLQASNDPIPAKYRGEVCFCDHCKTRRVKKHLYIIERDGEYMRVGKSCLKSFFNKNIEAYAKLFQSITDLYYNEKELLIDSDWIGCGISIVNVKEILECASALIIRDGFFPASHTDSTIGYIFKILSGKMDIKISEKAASLAALTIEYFKKYDGDNNFMLNVKSLMAKEYCEIKRLGFLAAAVNTYKKKIEKEEREKEANKNRKPLPKTDDRLEITGTIVKAIWKEDLYSYTPNYVLKIIIESPEGWKAYGSVPSKLEWEEVDDLINRKISFCAKISSSDKDEYFGFFKRPTKAKFI